MQRLLALLLAAVGSSASAIEYTVTTIADPSVTSVNAANGEVSPGVVSLRSAVLAANASGPGPHIINVPAGLGTYNLEGMNPDEPGTYASAGLTDLQVGSDGSTIIIRGTGGRAAIVQTTPNIHVITTGYKADYNPAVVNLTLESLDISGGTYTGIFVGADDTVRVSSTTIRNCRIHNNTNGADSFGAGGAIYAETGFLTIEDSLIENNSATYPSTGQGGALYYSLPNLTGQGSTGGLTITNTIFRNNTAALATSGAIGGGAIYANVGSTTGTPLLIQDCLFENNRTTAGADGGAVAIDGNRIAQVTRNTFLGNSVSGSGGNGGAIVVNNGNTTLRYNRFSGNTAIAGASGNTLYLRPGSLATVDANDNWWSRNQGPAAGDLTGGTITATKWLRFTHTATPGTITILEPQKSATLTLSFLTNSDDEPIDPANLSELVGLPVSFGSPVLGTISNADATLGSSGTATATFTAGNLGGDGSATASCDGGSAVAGITILAPRLDIVGAEVDEGGETLTFTVTRSVTTVGVVTVDYATSSDTATEGTDYSGATGTLTFANGVETRTFSVSLTDDDIVELDETFTATLSNLSAGTLGTALGVGTITNDDSAILGLASTTVVEGDSGTTTLAFQLSLDFATDVDVTVTRETLSSGSATPGVDFTSLSPALLTIPAGQTSASFQVTIISDNEPESDETLAARLSNLTASGRSIEFAPFGGATEPGPTIEALGTIQDDDPPLLAATGALGANLGVSGKIRVTDLLALSSPVEGRAVSFVSVQNTPTAAGGTVTFNDGWIHYQPPVGFSGVDSFTYTITDGVLTVTGTVTVTIDPSVGSQLSIYRQLAEGDGRRLLALGIPGRSYQLQISSDLSAWSNLGAPVACPSSGAMSLLDPGPLPSERFYRLTETAPLP